jgi:hypothetical protein
MAEEMSAEDVIFGGGGVPGAKWEQVGAWVGGRIRVKPRTYHAKEYVPGQPGGGRPVYKQNGEPVMGVRVDVVTGQRDPAIEHDDGTRRMHLDKWRQLEAVRRALTEAGVNKLETDGELWVQWTGEEADGNGGQSAKTWNAKYRPPSNGVEVPGAPAPQQFQTYGHGAPPAQVQAPVQSAPAANYAYAGQPHAAVPGAAPTAPTYPPGYGMGAPAPSGPPAGPTAPPAANPAAAGPQAVPAPAGAPGPTNTITASVAAALRAQGVDTSGFTIIPG